MFFSYNSETNLRTKENYLNDPVATYGTNKGICTFSFNCSFTSRITANSIRLLHFCRHKDQLGVCPLWTTNPTSLLPAASPLPISGPSLTIPPYLLDVSTPPPSLFPYYYKSSWTPCTFNSISLYLHPATHQPSPGAMGNYPTRPNNHTTPN